MTEMTYVPLPGSERTALPQAASAGSLDETEHITVTLITRRKAALPRTAAGSLARISRDDLAQNYGSDRPTRRWSRRCWAGRAPP